MVGTLKNKQGISRTFLAEKVDENFVYVAKGSFFQFLFLHFILLIILEDSGASAATAYTVLDAIGNEASNKVRNIIFFF